MEEQLVQILVETQSPQRTLRLDAESRLDSLYSQRDTFAFSLVAVASHASLALNVRQAALLALKNFVLSSWSPAIDSFKGEVLVSEEGKAKFRDQLLQIATSSEVERKIQSAAALVVSKIASADWPHDWTNLLPQLLELVPRATDAQLHGALKVLAELVDDGLNEDQFFQVAKDLINVVHSVATDERKAPSLRALAISVFRGCFDTLEMVMEDHKTAVKAFAEESIASWMPLFVGILKTGLPEKPPNDGKDGNADAAEFFKGSISIKLQVVKVLMRIRNIFPSLLTTHSPMLFESIWSELTALQATYQATYIQDEQESRLEDSDGLPYTLDFLILEELDFMNACLRAPPVRKELERQSTSQSPGSGWVSEMVKLAIFYAQITTEEEGIWQFDLNVFLSEEAEVTANYTPRLACGDLLIKLAEWQAIYPAFIQALFSYSSELSHTKQDWRLQEASLYMLQQVMNDWHESERTLDNQIASGFLELSQVATQQLNDFLRARAYLVLANLVGLNRQSLAPHALGLAQTTLTAVTNDKSEVVQVSCIRALNLYISNMPRESTVPLQTPIIDTLSQWLAGQDLNELTESDDLLITVLEALRDVLLLDTRICVGGDGLRILFTIASRAAANFQVAALVAETFEQICEGVAELGPEVYTQLCQATLPSLIGAFDVGNMTEENELTSLAADLLGHLTKSASTPLPPGFVAAVMPKLKKLLLGSADDELLRACTSTVNFILEKDADQVFAWQDPETNKPGHEVVLVIIDRLLNPSIEDGAAAEVGGLASELVQRAGHERLGPYLPQLLQAVAVRLASAVHAHLIQSLCTVFSRLALINVTEVVDFLAQLQIGSESGLQAVLTKWLENSINFVGYTEIRQNVLALAKVYMSHAADQRLESVVVKGDIIVPKSDRIMTRSKAKENPPTYVSVSAPVKILKVLVEELSAAESGNELGNAAAAAAAQEAEADEEGDSDDDEEWEDDPGDFIDLGLGATKAELMAFANDDGTSLGPRQRDDETQANLVQFFREASNLDAFRRDVNGLNEGEKSRLAVLLG